VITELSLPDELAQCFADETEGTGGTTQADVDVVTFSVVLSTISDLIRTSVDSTEDGNLVTVLDPPRTSSDWWLEEHLNVETVDDDVETDAVDDVKVLTAVDLQDDDTSGETNGDISSELRGLDEELTGKFWLVFKDRSSGELLVADGNGGRVALAIIGFIRTI